MHESVHITVSVRAVMRREGRRWVVGCPKLDIWSQGSTREDAQRCLREAVELWVEDCVSRGTLDQALREVGFHPVLWGTAMVGAADSVANKRTAEEEVIGQDFPLSVSVPAYQAAAFFEAAAAK